MGAADAGRAHCIGADRSRNGRTRDWRRHDWRRRSAAAAERTLTQPSNVATSGAMPGEPEMPSDRRRAACRSRSAACRWWCRASQRPRRRWRRRRRRARVPAAGRRRRVQAGLSGRKLAPVMATSRPPSGSRARAEAMCRKRRVRHAAIDVGDRREWRVHQHDARRDAGVEMIVDMRGVEARDGDARKEK